MTYEQPAHGSPASSPRLWRRSEGIIAAICGVGLLRNRSGRPIGPDPYEAPLLTGQIYLAPHNSWLDR
jgi:hypothetical protein